jgi:hypothetical protein
VLLVSTTRAVLAAGAEKFCQFSGFVREFAAAYHLTVWHGGHLSGVDPPPCVLHRRVHSVPVGHSNATAVCRQDALFPLLILCDRHDEQLSIVTSNAMPCCLPYCARTSLTSHLLYSCTGRLKVAATGM